MQHIVGKLSTRATTFLWTSLQYEVCTKRYGPPKLQESQFQEFLDSNLGALRQNDIWVLAPWLDTNNNIRGRWWFPPSLGRGEYYESMFVCVSSIHQKCSNYALTNLLFGLCRSVWVIDLLVTLLSPYLKAPTCTFILEMLRAKERTPTPHSFVLFALDSHLNLLKSLGVCQL